MADLYQYDSTTISLDLISEFLELVAQKCENNDTAIGVISPKLVWRVFPKDAKQTTKETGDLDLHDWVMSKGYWVQKGPDGYHFHVSNMESKKREIAASVKLRKDLGERLKSEDLISLSMSEMGDHFPMSGKMFRGLHSQLIEEWLAFHGWAYEMVYDEKDPNKTKGVNLRRVTSTSDSVH